VPLRSADDAFNHLDEGRTADLILLTLDSELKGLDFVRRLKSQDERQHIPIAIFASGAGPDEADVVQCSGAQCYLEKTLDFDGHVRLASKLVALYGSEQ
jgi:CheY-like chemotaxis protein